jgi:polysaccharide biosynthesis/export protein
MRGILRAHLISAFLACALLFQATAVSQTPETAATGSSGAAEGHLAPKKEPALTGDRHPLYRLRKSDVLEIHFTFAPEYDQSVTVLPDGTITLKGIGSLLAEGASLPELTQNITQAYAFMRDPELSIVLKDFEKPFFIAGGQLGRPGKYELHSPTTVSEAVAIAGGFTELSKHSQVVLFRRVHEGFVEARVLNLKAMLASRNLDEDVELRADDMIYVPQNRISKIKKYLPVASLSTFFTPAQF